MNGQKSDNISRRKFILLTGSVIGLIFFYSSFFFRSKKRIITITDISPDVAKGHRLRSGAPPAFDEKKNLQTGTVIVGAGVSGLVAARKLKKFGFDDFLVVDLEKKTGGNASAHRYQEFRFPTGAHYLTIPNKDNYALRDFLEEEGWLKVASGVPVYNEEFLIHEPEERCFFHGKWHQGLVPQSYLSEEAVRDFEKFQKLLDDFALQNKVEIPIRHSVFEEDALELDKIFFSDYLMRNSLENDEFLHYLDYCCRDDYGGGIDKVSALAGLFFFTARKPFHQQSSHSEYLTWNHGNQELVDKLMRYSQDKTITDVLVYHITKTNNGFKILGFSDKESVEINADCVILATPHYINSRIVRINGFKERTELNWSYFPWIIINFIIDNGFEPGNLSLAWDNIFYGSSSLGYIHSTHQNLEGYSGSKVFTYYKSCCKHDDRKERSDLFSKSNEEIVEEAISELEKAHPNIRELIKEAFVCKRGHGMICPVPGMLSALVKSEIDSGVERLFLAHSDYSGYSVFEEAFYNGDKAALKSIQSIS